MNLIDHIRPQLAEYIDDRFFDGYTPDALLRPLKTQYWHEDPIYLDMKLHADHADMPVLGWLSAADYFGVGGDALNNAFITAIRETIERQWEIRLDDLQRDFIHGMERTAGKVTAA